MSKNQLIPSVNFHLWEPCNMRCKFCFATFQDVKKSILPKGHLSKEDSLEVVRRLAEIGFEKITFAGGEPTLCPWLSDLIITAKSYGLTTVIVTNGSNIDDKFLGINKNVLDWIAVSIDSLASETNLASGRAIYGRTAIENVGYRNLVDRITNHGFGLKVNTVVTRRNINEDMSEFITYAEPKRWKLFQVLPIQGQNDSSFEKFRITDEEFQAFVKRHDHLKLVTEIISENNLQMSGSYAMVDPAGRFFDNASGKHKYSRPILQTGCAVAIEDVQFQFEKFVSRGGLYDWQVNK